MATSSRKLLIAMDGSKNADYAFQWFMRYFFKDRDDVILLYCSEHGGVVTGPIPASDPAMVSKLAKEDEGEIVQLITTMQQLINTAGIKGSVLRMSGKPGEAIVKAAEEQKVDIIVTGTRGLGTVRRTLMGSVSQYVVHHAKCPVLVIRDK